MAEPFGFPLDRAARLGASLRAATDDDLPFLSALYATTRADELAMTGWPEATKSLFVIHQFTAQHRGYAATFPNAIRAIVMREGDAIGRLYIDPRADTCHIVDISLIPPMCGQGLGGALIADLQSHAAEAKRDVTLSVLPHSIARKLYVRLGFKADAVNPDRERMRWRGLRG